MVKKKDEFKIIDGKKYKLIEEDESKDERVEFFEQWSDEQYCLKAVERNGYALRYVKEQSVFEKITGLKVKKNAKKRR